MKDKDFLKDPLLGMPSLSRLNSLTLWTMDGKAKIPGEEVTSDHQRLGFAGKQLKDGYISSGCTPKEPILHSVLRLPKS